MLDMTGSEHTQNEDGDEGGDNDDHCKLQDI